MSSENQKHTTDETVRAIWSYLTSIKVICRGNGEQEAFNPEKIRAAIFLRLQECHVPDEQLMHMAHNATSYVLDQLQRRFDGHTIPQTSDIRIVIDNTLIHFGFESPSHTMNSHDTHHHPIEPSEAFHPASSYHMPETGSATQKVVRSQARRQRLNEERKAITHKFQVGKYEGYITVGLYDDTRQPGEIFLTMNKEGSMMSGLVDAFATSISIGLQYGVPLKVFVDKFSNMRFEPSGLTQNPNIPEAKSIVDYVFRWLAMKFLTPEERQSLAMFDTTGPGLSPYTEEPLRSASPASSPQSTLLDPNDPHV